MTTDKQVFHKSYERDISLVLELAWVEEFVRGLKEKYNFENPYPPTYILYVTEHSLQIWENEKSISAFQDWLLQKNTTGTEFILDVLGKYEPILSEIRKYWANGGMTDNEQLLKYLKLTLDGALLFTIWYYSCVDDRTPEAVKNIVDKVREKDVFFAENSVYIRKCLEKLGVKPHLSNFVFLSEFPNVPTNEVLESRMKAGVVTVDDAEINLTSLKDFTKKHSEYEFVDLHLTHENKKEVKGQVAFKGKVSGRVSVVRNHRDMEKVKDGDVLVSPMTTPDFLSAMNRAVAFVTDEGGVMCHAAIVAREISKPCVTGTKYATDIFKDGDMVEVDAETGIVKII